MLGGPALPVCAALVPARLITSASPILTSMLTSSALPPKASPPFATPFPIQGKLPIHSLPNLAQEASEARIGNLVAWAPERRLVVAVTDEDA